MHLYLLDQLHASEPRIALIDILFSENILILDPLSFSDFIGLKGELRDQFIECVNLTKDATWKNDDSKEKLKQKAIESQKIFMERYNFGQAELERYIDDPNTELTSEILKYDPHYSRLDFWV